MNKIGIIGGGVMGAGVAQSFAQYKFKVILVDISNDILQKTKGEITRNIKLYKLCNSKENLDDIDIILSRIEFTTDYNELKDCSIIVENASENFDIKKEIYRRIDTICNENSIFLANTSCISITKIASLTERPDKVIGAHFMNPVPMKKTIEVIKGYYTSESTIEETKKIAFKIEKRCILVNDLPGFVSNRISHLFMNEAAYVVQDQVGTPEQVDDIFRDCYGHKMGPLETADLIGLDTVVKSLDVLYESYRDPKFRCCPLLRKMVDAKLYGRKTGKGFYKYNIY
ncbi:3-hydroxyacyl-CoA dehydrogenase family protein [Clostridium frigidicarnis]|uniref:3-hydroxybutyryl-CoA dehydrogenase n=1 Tax=Clostridium frigidicarnis TaxID=84698 RepID=A0A1I0Y4J4_9CLOT|nr:3-hydroxyacyl-CoA dehydrogenase NAD-binding domain-containing protein [Clostridium frigidicarnis]SFB07767.1 3-hydroxybutyryl-CoA dehydrogenase [Clostridium frigidicarnis]